MFEELKQIFIIEPVLVALELNKEIRVEVEVLDLVIGEVLLMKYKDKKYKLIAYISKSLNECHILIWLYLSQPVNNIFFFICTLCSLSV